jgi:hypothetical protein
LALLKGRGDRVAPIRMRNSRHSFATHSLEGDYHSEATGTQTHGDDNDLYPCTKPWTWCQKPG